MINKTKKYSNHHIELLVSSLMNDEDSFNLLLTECPELAAVCDVLIHGNTNAHNWLIKNKFITLLAFISALNKYSNAIDYLMRKNEKCWAATVSAFHNDLEAGNWLEKNNFNSYNRLAQALRFNFPIRHRSVNTGLDDPNVVFSDSIFPEFHTKELNFDDDKWNI